MPATAHPQPFEPQQGASVNVVHLCAEQSSHVPPAVPHTAIVLPVRHLPSASQQPMQIIEQRDGPASPLSAAPLPPESGVTPASGIALASVAALSSSSVFLASTTGPVASISVDEVSGGVVASRDAAASSAKSVAAAPEQASGPPERQASSPRREPATCRPGTPILTSFR
jgi:hypothetical protein